MILFLLAGCGTGEDMQPSVSSAEQSGPAPAATDIAGPDSGAESAPDTAQSDTETEQTESAPAAEPSAKPAVGQTPEMTDDSTFEIYFLNVGQGDAACVLCDGKAMLIDGGNSSGSDLIYSFLKSHAITRLEYIIATHPDADHVGGLAGALNYASAGKVYCTVTQHDSEAFNDFLKYLDRQNGEITVPSPGDSFYLGCSRVTILFPEQGRTWSDNTSIALRIEYGDTSFLFTGDCEAEDEAVLLADGYGLKSDVLKVAHHGSKYSTGSALLRSVEPEFAVISVGGSNPYDHPAEEVLSRLAGQDVTLYRTDIHGDIHCTSDGEKVRFDVEKNSDIDAYITAGGYKNYLEELNAQKSAAAAGSAAEDEGTEKSGSGADYIANKNTGKFHYPSCSSVDKMKESNKLYFTGTRDELIGMGYEPCGRCHP